MKAYSKPKKCKQCGQYILRTGKNKNLCYLCGKYEDSTFTCIYCKKVRYESWRRTGSICLLCSQSLMDNTPPEINEPTPEERKNEEIEKPLDNSYESESETLLFEKEIKISQEE